MTLYELDTFKQAMKKYVVTLTLGIGIGLYLGCCTYKSNKSETNYLTTSKLEKETNQSISNTALSRDEQRLKVFESYTAPYK